MASEHFKSAPFAVLEDECTFDVPRDGCVSLLGIPLMELSPLVDPLEGDVIGHEIKPVQYRPEEHDGAEVHVVRETSEDGFEISSYQCELTDGLFVVTEEEAKKGDFKEAFRQGRLHDEDLVNPYRLRTCASEYIGLCAPPVPLPRIVFASHSVLRAHVYKAQAGGQKCKHAPRKSTKSGGSGSKSYVYVPPVGNRGFAPNESKRDVLATELENFHLGRPVQTVVKATLKARQVPKERPKFDPLNKEEREKQRKEARDRHRKNRPLFQAQAGGMFESIKDFLSLRVATTFGLDKPTIALITTMMNQLSNLSNQTVAGFMAIARSLEGLKDVLQGYLDGMIGVLFKGATYLDKKMITVVAAFTIAAVLRYAFWGKVSPLQTGLAVVAITMFIPDFLWPRVSNAFSALMSSSGEGGFDGEFFDVEEGYEAQANFFGIEAETISDALSLFLIGAFQIYPSKNKASAFISGLKNLKYASEGVERIVSLIFSYISEAWSSLFGKVPGFISIGGPEMISWVDQIEQLAESAKMGTLRFSSTVHTRLRGLMRQGRSFEVEMDPRSPEGRSVRQCMKLLEKLYEPYKHRERTGQPRQQPVSLLFRGESGVGKSFAVRPIIASIAARVLPEEQLSYLKENIDQLIYDRQFEHKYWDSYNSQFFCVFDDIFQAKDVAGEPDNEVFNIIRCADNTKTTLHMADLADKGVTQFDSHFIIGTTNLKRFEFASIVENEAVMRRWDYVIVVAPKVEWSIPETRGLDVSRRRLDTSQLDGTFNKDIYEFRVQKLRPGTHDEFDDIALVDFDGLIDLIVRRYRAVSNAHETYQGSINGIIEEQLRKRAAQEVAEAQMAEGCSREFGRDQRDQREWGEAQIMSKGFGLVSTMLTHSMSLPPEVSRDVEGDYVAVNWLEVAYDQALRMFKGTKMPPIRQISDWVKFTEFIETVMMSIEGVDAGWQWLSMPETKGTKLPDLTSMHCKMHRRALSALLAFLLVGEDLGNVQCRRCCHFYHMLLAPSVRCLSEHLLMLTQSTGRNLPALERVKKLANSLDKFFDSNVKTLSIGVRVNSQVDWARIGLMKFRWSARGSEVFSMSQMHLLDYFGAYDPNDPRMTLESVEEVRTIIIKNFFDEVGRVFAKCKDTLKTKLGDWAAMGYDGCTRALGFVRRHRVVISSVIAFAAVGIAVYFGVRKTPTPTDEKTEGDSVGEAQLSPAFVDPVLDDVVESVFKRNSYILCTTKVDVNACLEGGANQAGAILMITGRVGALPHHYFELWRAKVEAGEATMNAPLYLIKPGANLVYTLTLGQLFGGMCDMPGKDLAFVRLPQNIPPARDIRDKFVTLDDIKKRRDLALDVIKPRASGSYVRCIVDHGTIRDSHTLCHTKGKRYTAKNVIRYRAPNQKGDCGSIVLLRDPTTTQRKIVGIHIGGMPKVGEAIGTTITREDIAEAAEIIDFETQGKLDVLEISGYYRHPWSSTTLKKSPLYEAWGPSTKAPAVLRPIVIDGVEVDPAEKAVHRYQNPVPEIPEESVTLAAEAYTKVVMEGLSQEQCDKQVVSFEVAVEGVDGDPFMNGLPRGTSAGFPYALEPKKYGRGKTGFFGEDGPVVYSEKADEIKQEVQNIICSARQGVRRKHVYLDVLKDERRSLKKVAAADTRLVSACPLPLTIAFRMFFLTFVSQFMKARLNVGSAVGMNVYSEEWDLLAHSLQAHPHLIAGDFKGFDSSHHPTILWAVCEVICTWYGNEDDNKVRRTLWLEVVNSRHLWGSLIYQWDHALPSGNPLTTIINTIYVQIAYRCCYLEIFGRSARTLSTFSTHVELFAYGDDNVASVSAEIEPQFNQKTLPGAFEKFGLTFTPETKEEEVDYTSRELKDVTFLKRSFRREPALGRFVAPLDMETIVQGPYYMRKGPTAISDLKDLVDTNLMELALHGKEKYENLAPKMYNAAHEKLGHWPARTSWYSNLIAAGDLDVHLGVH